jgi:hypothetical protein
MLYVVSLHYAHRKYAFNLSVSFHESNPHKMILVSSQVFLVNMKMRLTVVSRESIPSDTDRPLFQHSMKFIMENGIELSLKIPKPIPCLGLGSLAKFLPI